MAASSAALCVREGDHYSSFGVRVFSNTWKQQQRVSPAVCLHRSSLPTDACTHTRPYLREERQGRQDLARSPACSAISEWARAGTVRILKRAL